MPIPSEALRSSTAPASWGGGRSGRFLTTVGRRSRPYFRCSASAIPSETVITASLRGTTRRSTELTNASQERE